MCVNNNNYGNEINDGKYTYVDDDDRRSMMMIEFEMRFFYLREGTNSTRLSLVRELCKLLTDSGFEFAQTKDQRDAARHTHKKNLF
jgi:hypothetical protein